MIDDKIDLEKYYDSLTLKSLINSKKINNISYKNDKRNFYSERDFHSDYVIQMYLDSKELVDFLGSYVYIVKSLDEPRNRVLKDVTGNKGARGSLNHIRSTSPKEVINSYNNITKNPDFKDDSEMIKYKIKSIIDEGDSTRIDTKTGNYINSNVKFFFSTLDLFEKGVKIELEKDFIYHNNERYKIVLVRPEKYFNNEVFLFSFECEKEKAEVK
ncbi:MAG: hypothetical protein KatS3mg068_1581 [Candidatus Sericytochromatia bacterium]|nr:MAG: hypothetical protein KatS3mg068_1581 [Candidatus Sericytochromatia bacterium]